MIRKTGLVFGLLCLFTSLYAQNTFTLSGRVTDSNTAEPCQGAVVRVADSGFLWTVTDQQGAYGLHLAPGHYVLELTYVGYEKGLVELDIAGDTQYDFSLKPLAYILNTVTVLAESKEQRLRNPEMSIERIDTKIIQKVPVLFGEADPIKILHLLPGVQSANEGSSSYSVRGGSPDQNLILFDYAGLHNISHMMGFFSVFNNDAVESMNLYKGDIPANYGGRLSSLLDVRAKAGTPDFALNGGIGLIASRLCVEGNMGTPDLTFLAAGRRTYADLFLKFFKDEILRNTNIHFYDVNTKIRWRANDNNYLNFTFYNGRDRFKSSDMGMYFGNMASTLNWDHGFSPKLHLKTVLTASKYHYDFSAAASGIDLSWLAGITDVGLRVDFSYVPNAHTRFAFGCTSNFQWFKPGDAVGVATLSGAAVSQEIKMSPRQSFVNVLYFSNHHEFLEKRLNIRYGLRFTRFDGVGPTTLYPIDEDYTLLDPAGTRIPSGKFFYHSYGWEPRVGLSCSIGPALSVKASYARTLQYVHLLSFSSAGSPLEIWIPSNATIKPQVANQFTAGVFANFLDGKIETCAEVFYKRLDHIIDFKEHPNLLLYDQIETELRYGKGNAYGVEFMAKKPRGRFSGWLSYTYSRSFRTVEGVNDNQPYSSPYDRPHSISVVGFYDLNRRLSFSLNWIYATGQPVTLPEGRYWYFNELVPVYSKRNGYRLPDYHRMDISATLILGKMNRRFRSELNFSIYNVYARKNPWAINYRLHTDGQQYLQMTYLFSVVPSVTWNFKF